MNKQEAIKLLALIKVAYPMAYKDMDEATKKATVNMWAGSFPDVPYPIMEQAFNHFRMVSKFPPTVAEMVDELSHIYHQALEGALTNKALGMEEAARMCWAIVDITARYKNDSNLGGLNLRGLQGLLSGGDYNVQRLGTSGDYEMP
jgi:hypothetical protein